MRLLSTLVPSSAHPWSPTKLDGEYHAVHAHCCVHGFCEDRMLISIRN